MSKQIHKFRRMKDTLKDDDDDDDDVSIHFLSQFRTLRNTFDTLHQQVVLFAMSCLLTSQQINGCEADLALLGVSLLRQTKLCVCVCVCVSAHGFMILFLDPSHVYSCGGLLHIFRRAVVSVCRSGRSL